MSLLNFYVILIILGLVLEVFVLVLNNNQAATEQIAFCFVAGIIFLIFGIRGVVGKLKAYM